MKSKLYAFLKKTIGGLVGWMFRVHVYGAENEPTAEQGQYIVVSNHISNADPVFLCVALNHQQPHFMAKKELFKVPLVNKLVAALGAYPVDRGGADVAAIKKTIKMLGEGISIGMFPQGHRRMKVDPRQTEGAQHRHEHEHRQQCTQQFLHHVILLGSHVASTPKR